MLIWYAAVASTSPGGWGRVLGCVLMMLGTNSDTIGSAFGVSSPVSHPFDERQSALETQPIDHRSILRKYAPSRLQLEIGNCRPSPSNGDSYQRPPDPASRGSVTQERVSLVCGEIPLSSKTNHPSLLSSPGLQRHPHHPKVLLCFAAERLPSSIR